ncbi:hypothetical protein [Pseudoalteromonas piscicida]|uniref:Lipoprotein n=1 Tax=Pseudoalteromonas piscicida TaxID=43662 RepID=A0A2A5JPB7_PSEO7|nr:hypothetical protein [Pseudoalteromonas piscicida]PCK31276.1 hypothetical protein CEX98_13315 [Pseudoalteromonas piscicida]
MKKIAVSMSLVMWLAGCAHHDDVRPSTGGTHEILLFAKHRDSGSQAAMRQAKHYCKQKGLSVHVINLDVEYKGSEPESNYIEQKVATHAMEAAGMAMWIFGRNSVEDVGAAVTLGSAITSGAASSEPYDVKLNFKCHESGKTKTH